MRKIILLAIFTITICTMIYSCQSESEIELASYVSNGKDIYIKYCQNCHGEKGEGLGQLAPPLTDSVFLKENKSQLACFIKNGVNKPMVINGKTYQEKMPSFPQLENIDIAQVIVYVTNSFGNKQGIYQHQLVESDLRNCK
ncbi:c-type cytochrome [Pedobacter polaris]|uniref:C-type cytochrome n=1 Tax=Pedobacter polaris TaxID=2571273 RepID=A0A4U1CRQ1_9SPHI|nr:cytochrome c [Pedobacter polaris]TKC10384.1 c-type cytochrome [Pedobacter polaris]